MEEEDDDFYAPNDDTPGVAPSDINSIAPPPPAIKQEKNGVELEEGEEEGEEVEEDESDSVSLDYLQALLKLFAESIDRTLISSRNGKTDRSPNRLPNLPGISLSRTPLQEPPPQIMEPRLQYQSLGPTHRRKHHH